MPCVVFWAILPLSSSSLVLLQTGLRFCLVVAAAHLENQDLDLRQRHKGRCYVIPKRDKPSDTAQRGSERSKKEKRIAEGEAFVSTLMLCHGKFSWKNMGFVFVDVSPSAMVVFTLCLLWWFLPLSHNATDFSVCDFPGRPMPGQKARLQSRLPFLLSMTLKLPGRLPGSSPPISTNQVTFENMLSYTRTLHRCASPESVNVSKQAWWTAGALRGMEQQMSCESLHSYFFLLTMCISEVSK